MDGITESSEKVDLHQNKSSKNWLKQLIGIFISIGCLAIIFHQVNFSELQQAFFKFKWQFIFVGLLSLAFDYIIRIQRWAVMLRSGGANVSWRTCASPFLGSITLNNLLPFRTGDLVRAFVFPAAMGISRMTAGASLVLERLIDLLALLFFLGLGLYFNSLITLPRWVSEMVFLLSLSGGVILFLIMAFNTIVSRALFKIKGRVESIGYPRFGYIIENIGILIQSLGEMSRFQVLATLFCLSIFLWIGEAGLFWAVLKGLGVTGGFSVALMIMAVATLSTLVPSSPGYVGPFHLAAFSIMSLLGETASQATTYAVLVHFWLWLPTTLVGGIAMLMNPQLFQGQYKRYKNAERI